MVVTKYIIFSYYLGNGELKSHRFQNCITLLVDFECLGQRAVGSQFQHQTHVGGGPHTDQPCEVCVVQHCQERHLLSYLPVYYLIWQKYMSSVY